MGKEAETGVEPHPETKKSRAKYGVMVAKDIMLPMRDGVRLATDIYRPARDGEPVPGKFPAVLLRTIYDKSSGRLVKYMDYFCKRGYVSVVQDCRGRFNSDGDYYHGMNEAKDGYDTVEWLAAHDWSDGKVGTFGGSYESWVQSAMATQNPPHLSAMVPRDGPSNIYSYGLRHDGAFQLKFLTVGFQLGADSKEAAANPAISQALERVSEWLWRLPLKRGRSPLALVPNYERFVFDFMTRGDYDEYWANPSFNIEAHYDQHSDIPIYFVGGWYDSWSRATLTQFVELSECKKGPIRVLMGPWTHGGESVTYSGDVDFGPQATLIGNLAEDYNDWLLRWFDHTLKGVKNSVADQPPMKMFVMGGGSGRRNTEGRLDHGGYWRDECEWPLARTEYTDYFLHADGTLRPDVPAHGEPPSRYRYDPDDPVPTISGNLSGMAEVLPIPEGISGGEPISRRWRPLAPPGAAHQKEYPGGFGCKPPYLPLSARQDVLVFQTPPFTEDVELTGPITVKLWASSSAVDTDFTAKLLDIYPISIDYPDGYHMNICEGIIRARYRDFSGKAKLLEPREICEFTIILEPTSNLFKAGHRIRLDISSSNFPRFDINPNTGEPVGQHTHTIVAENVVYHDARHPSHVVFPIIPGQGR